MADIVVGFRQKINVQLLGAAGPLTIPGTVVAASVDTGTIAQVSRDGTGDLWLRGASIGTTLLRISATTPQGQAQTAVVSINVLPVPEPTVTGVDVTFGPSQPV